LSRLFVTEVIAIYPPGSSRHNMQLWCFFAFVFFCFCQPAFAISNIQISVGAVEAPAGDIKNAEFLVDLKGDSPSLKLKAEVKPANEPQFIPFDLRCGTFWNPRIGVLECLNGMFTAKRIRVPLSVHFGIFPDDFSANIDFKQANFSDEAGLHAGEKLTGSLRMAAKKEKDIWHWGGLFSWTEGELFWQPFYFGKAGNDFAISGTFKAPTLNITQASLQVNEVGTLAASAQVNTHPKRWKRRRLKRKTWILAACTPC